MVFEKIYLPQFLKNSSNKSDDETLSSHGQTGANILIIDDSVDMLSLLKKFIDKEKLGQCHIFKNEFNAMSFLTNGKADLLIIDVNLTTVNGFKVGQIMRDIIKAEVPIIYITSDESYLKAFYQHEQRNTYFMQKPITKKVLKEVVDNMLLSAA